jgi:D-alanyl-D-alanine carboxypeptidase/D-alanyl-D-alanine-endopeptidase (penicillin-binding protein 4)
MAALILGACGGAAQTSVPHRVAATLPPVGRRIHARRVSPPSPALRALRASLEKRLRRAGAGASALVFDLNAHRILFALRPDALRPPASLEKLYTSVAVLRRLGPGATLLTRVLGTGRLGARGAWRGNLYLRGGGDPTLGDQRFNRTWEEGYGPTATQLTDELAARGIRRVNGAVIGDPSLFDARPGPPSSGYSPDISDLGGQLAGLTYDHGSTAGSLSPGAFAARQLARTMRRATRLWPRSAHHPCRPCSG